MGSDSLRATVTLPDSTSVKLFLKLCVAGSKVAEYNEQGKIFDKEAHFFLNILPKLLQFQEERSLDEKFRIDAYLPHCYKIGKTSDDGTICILFRDFMSEGFGGVPNDAFMSLEHIHESLRGLAKFHALSFTLMRSDQELQQKWREDHLLDVNLAHEEKAAGFKTWMADPLTAFLKIQLHMLTSKSECVEKNLKVPENVTEEKLKRLIEKNENLAVLNARCRKQTGTVTDVLIHGDFHMFNVATKGNKDILMFDFQWASIGNFALDVQQFLPQASTPDQRKEHLDAFLETYSATFTEAVKALGQTDDSILAGFALDEVKMAYKRQSPVGFAFGLGYVPPRYVDWDQLQAARKLATDGKTAELTKTLKDFGPKFWNNLQLIFDLLSEYIDIMLEYE